MKKIYFLALIVFVFSGFTYAQLSVTANNTNFTIDFDNTLSGVNNGAYTGTGAQSSPSAGQFDSDGFAVTGWSTGALAFGGTQISTNTDYSRGASVNTAVSTGGMYALSGGNISTGVAFGFQPGSTDWAPGTLTLKMTNNTGLTVTSMTFSYVLYVRNDQGRSNSFNFSHSTDDATYTAVGSLDFTSTAALDAAGFVSNSKSTTVSGLNIANGANYFIRWSGADVGGSGSRDEFALDNIVVRMNDALPISLLSFQAKKLSETIQINWSTASEINNDKFIIERSKNATDFEEIASINGAGNSQEILTYSFEDETPLKGTSYYRLKQIDFNGSSETFKTVAVNNGFGKLTIEQAFAKEQNIHLSIYSPMSAETTILLYDINGRILLEEKKTLTEGYNKIQFVNNKLQPGIHLIKIQNLETEVMKKFIY